MSVSQLQLFVLVTRSQMNRHRGADSGSFTVTYLGVSGKATRD